VRPRLLAVLSALLLAAALPAGATTLDESTEPEVQVCPSGEKLTPEGFSGQIETPSLITGDGFTATTFRLDLDAPAGSRADVDVTISWGLRTNDYDLAVNGETSLGLQPVADAVENVTVRVTNCGFVNVTVEEFVAPLFVDTIDLEITVRPL
jgi:hypothetical protein